MGIDMKPSTSMTIAGAAMFICGMAGSAAGNTTQGTGPALSGDLFKQMDADGDNRISKVEFLEFGSESLKKRGKRVDIFEIEKKFMTFDRNADGYITAEDPHSKSPEEVVMEKIVGTWSGLKDNGNRIEFVFMEDLGADMLQRGVSMRESARAAGGDMTYKLINPSKEPIALNLIAKGQMGQKTEIKCIIRFVSENEMQMRMASGGKFARRPREFHANGSTDMITLTRVQ